MERKAFLESMVLLTLLVISALFIPTLKGLFALLPILYYLIEMRLRKRGNGGFNFKSLVSDIKKSWAFIILVSAILQVFYFFIFNTYVPEMVEHLKERVSILDNLDVVLVISIFLFALGEEITFRGLFQNRLNWVMKPAYAILITSFLFTIIHFSKGEPLIVALDLTTVFLDSIIYGYIYYKTNNIYVSWIAHALANIIAAALILSY
ncbi:lysostaphin resistance A-like protein [Fredinandcohnia humi]